MTLIKLSSGKSFNIPAGATILEAARQAGIALPYSCKTGRCSTCKCKVGSGKTHALNPETGLTDIEKLDGWILSCVRTAETDTSLEVDDLNDMNLPVAKTWPCRISEIKRLALDVIQVFLRLPPTADLHFIPGQYIDIIGHGGVRRSYSLASIANDNKTLELHIRSVSGGAMSDYWFNHAKQNDLLRLHGPLGTFFLRNIVDVDLIFMATGTGIAPVKAMLESLAFLPEGKKPKSVTVLWGGRLLSDLYLHVDNIVGNFTYIPVLSRSNDNWSGEVGYVQDVLLRRNPDLSNAAVYVCGSDTMIHSAQKILCVAGLPANHFYSDAFVCSGSY